MTDLGTLPGGTYSVAVDVNARGLAVGDASDADGVQHAVAWDRGRIIDLGHLGGGDGSAKAVNDRGQILGESTGADGRPHRFVWDRGVLTDLGPVDPFTTSRDINNAGDVVGTFHATPGAYPCDCRAGMWRDGELIDLGTLGSTGAWLKSYPMDVNNRGVVVGASVTAQEEEHAFRWRDGVMHDLGTLGGPGSRAVAVNDHGAVIGFAAVADQIMHPFLWRDGAMTDLSERGLTVHDDLSDINDRGQLVGTRTQRAMLYR
jgi:probable HAF family extracellular repeat protein